MIVLIDVNAVLQLRPFVAGSRSTPRRDQRTIALELEDRRRGAPDRPRFVRLQGGRAVYDPHMIASIHRSADDRANDPVIRQRPRPRRVYAKRRGRFWHDPPVGSRLRNGRDAADGQAHGAG